MTALDLARCWARSPRILVVEDDKDEAKAVTDLLSHYPCDVQLVGTVADALSAIFLHQFDMALVDIGLPDGSGVEVVKALKENAPATPVIIMAGAVRRALEDVLPFGIVAVVQKPFDSLRQLREVLCVFKIRGCCNEASARA